MPPLAPCSLRNAGGPGLSNGSEKAVTGIQTGNKVVNPLPSAVDCDTVGGKARGTNTGTESSCRTRIDIQSRSRKTSPRAPGFGPVMGRWAPSPAALPARAPAPSTGTFLFPDFPGVSPFLTPLVRSWPPHPQPTGLWSLPVRLSLCSLTPCHLRPSIKRGLSISPPQGA